MNEIESLHEHSIDERDRVMARAEADAVFCEVARSLSDLVEQKGLPESAVEDVIRVGYVAGHGYPCEDLLILFRIFRHAALVNHILAGSPRIKERLTEKERDDRQRIQ